MRIKDVLYSFVIWDTIYLFLVKSALGKHTQYSEYIEKFYSFQKQNTVYIAIISNHASIVFSKKSYMKQINSINIIVVRIIFDFSTLLEYKIMKASD